MTIPRTCHSWLTHSLTFHWQWTLCYSKQHTAEGLNKLADSEDGAGIVGECRQMNLMMNIWKHFVLELELRPDWFVCYGCVNTVCVCHGVQRVRVTRCVWYPTLLLILSYVQHYKWTSASYFQKLTLSLTEHNLVYLVRFSKRAWCCYHHLFSYSKCNVNTRVDNVVAVNRDPLLWW